MLSDIDLVNLAAAIYNGSTGFDYYDAGDDDQITWGLKKLDGVDVVVLRGSITAHDWWEDLRAAPISTRIGIVHQGFHSGMEKMWADLKPMIDQPVAITGHSLGAARADILTALMVVDGKAPQQRAVFGEPRPGLDDLAKHIRTAAGSAYRNKDASGHDPVTDVPLKLEGPFDFVHPTGLVDLEASPPGNFFSRHGLFAYHHIQLYQQAMVKRSSVI